MIHSFSIRFFLLSLAYVVRQFTHKKLFGRFELSKNDIKCIAKQLHFSLGFLCVYPSNLLINYLALLSEINSFCLHFNKQLIFLSVFLSTTNSFCQHFYQHPIVSVSIFNQQPIILLAMSLTINSFCQQIKQQPKVFVIIFINNQYFCQ